MRSNILQFLFLSLIAILSMQCRKFSNDERYEVIGKYKGTSSSYSLYGSSSTEIRMKIKKYSEEKMVYVVITEGNASTGYYYYYEGDKFSRTEGGPAVMFRSGETVYYDENHGVMSKGSVVFVRQ